jgi:pimeloyl-ACP methyl ester carboxylesterase
MSWRCSAGVVAAMLGALLGPAPAPAQAPTDAFTARRCFVPLPPGLVDGRDVRCGHVRVPLDHRDPDGETIRIAVAVVAARTPTPAPDPLVFLGGGPGDELLALALAGTADPASGAAGVLASRDIVLLDQRGAGFSRPALRCNSLRATADAMLDARSAAVNRALLDRAAACARRLRRAGNELGAFTTPANARDLDRVRQALGYPQVNLSGTSYGSFLALEAARPSPPWIRSLILASPAPTDRNLVEDAPVSYRGSVRALAAACAASAACAAVTPDFEASLNRVVARLTRRPRRIRVPVEGRAPVEVLLDGPGVSGLVFLLLYAPEGIRALPGVIGAAERGDLFPLIGALAAITEAPDRLSEGMQFSFWCAEEIATTSPGRLRRAAGRVGLAQGRAFQNAPLLGLLFGPDAFALCDEWDVRRSPPSLFEPVRTAIPTLIVTGRFDPITPPAHGAWLARTLPRAFLVEIAAAGHSPLDGECGVALLTQFLADPLVAPDAACARAPLLP